MSKRRQDIRNRWQSNPRPSLTWWLQVIFRYLDSHSYSLLFQPSLHAELSRMLPNEIWLNFWIWLPGRRLGFEMLHDQSGSLRRKAFLLSSPLNVSSTYQLAAAEVDGLRRMAYLLTHYPCLFSPTQFARKLREPALDCTVYRAFAAPC